MTSYRHCSNTSRALEDWAYSHGVPLDLDRKGEPVENAFIGLFNGRLRDERLKVHQFTPMEDAKRKIEAWRVDYNQRRPHGSLGHLTLNTYSHVLPALQRDAAAQDGRRFL